MNAVDVLRHRQITFAQNREDLILKGFFKGNTKGFYVDVGANSPYEGSVTKIFYDMGWHGINIEPIHKLYYRLLSERTRDINLNLGVSNKSGRIKLREFIGSGYSTFSNEMKRFHSKNPNTDTYKYKDYEVEVVTLEHIFDTHKVKSIQFMKIDVEGYEHEVLEGNNWKKYRPEVLCIEANHVEHDWRPLLRDNGYRLAFFDGLNEYYIDQKNKNFSNAFSYVDDIILREPIVNYLLLPDIQCLINGYEERIADCIYENSIKGQRIHELESNLNEIISLKKHFRRQINVRLVNLDDKITKRLSAKQKIRNADHKVKLGDKEDIPAILKTTLYIDNKNYTNYVDSLNQTAALRTYRFTKLLLRKLIKYTKKGK